MNIGFIGQGWIGKHYADDFENRGYVTVRYSLEPEYRGNKDALQECGIVFIAVPTPTTRSGFDDSYVRSALEALHTGSIAVIKSTLLPGTTEKLQEVFPDLYILHSPEFLVEKTAAYDAANPLRQIIGIPKENAIYRTKAQAVLEVLPKAPYEAIVSAREAELIKYAGNCFLLTKVLFMNMLYDLAEVEGADWGAIKEALIHDPRIGRSHMDPLHNGGRGAGGHCFIKDFEAFRRLYDNAVKDAYGSRILEAQAEKNIALLVGSGKDLDLLRSVYGEIHTTASV